VYETFDHTADLGLRIIAPDIDTLFAEAGTALFSIIVEDSTTIRAVSSFDINIAGTDREYLLFDFLRELLYRFDAEQFLAAGFVVKLSGAGLFATISGEPFDAQRHLLNHEVKAITYHGLTVAETADGWVAEFIVDI